MKRIILLCSLIALALIAQAQNFTTGTWNKVTAKDTLVLSGRALAEVVYSVLVTSKNNEIPSAKSVWDLVQSQIGDKISGTGEAPRVAYFTNNDEIGGDPDLTFDGFDNILTVESIVLDGINNAVTAGLYNGQTFTMTGTNAAGGITNTSASSSTTGGAIRLRSNDGAAMGSGHQLGRVVFSGHTGTATGNEGATIEAYAADVYDGDSQPTRLQFSTIDDGENSPESRMVILPDGQIQLNSYGAGSITGTPAYTLAVDASGNVIETTGGGGDTDLSFTGSSSPVMLNSSTGDDVVFAGTTNQVNLAQSAGTLTFSLPQSIHMSATPTFSDVTTSDDVIVGDDITMNGSTARINMTGATTNTIDMGANATFTAGDGASEANLIVNGVGGQAYWQMGSGLAFIQQQSKNASAATVAGSPSNPIFVQIQNDGAALDNTHLLGGMQWRSRGASASTQVGGQLLARASQTWTDAARGTQIEIATVANDSTTVRNRLTIQNSGQIRLNPYGAGTYTGTAAYNLAVTSAGQVIEVAPSGGAAYYQTVYNGSSPLAQQENLVFDPSSTISWTLTNVPGDDATEVQPNIISGSITETLLADDAVTSAKIDDGTITAIDLNQMGAATSEVLSWDGTTWAADKRSDDSDATDLSADADDWNPTDWATSEVHFVGCDANIRAITGFEELPGGTERTIVNESAVNTLYVPAQHPDSDVANRVRGDKDYIVPPGGSITLVYSNNFSRWFVKSHDFSPSSLPVSNLGQFFYQAPGSTNQSDQPYLGFNQTGTSAGNGNVAPTTALPSAWEIVTGSTNAGIAVVYLPKNNNAFTAFGSAHIVAFGSCYIPTLSTSGQRFTAQFSLTNAPNGTTLAQNNAIGFRTSDNINSGAWEIYSRDNAGSESTASTGITAAANTFYTFTVSIDKARSEARYYMTDGTNSYTGRLTGNMPNAVICGPRWINAKSVGTTSRAVNVTGIGGYSIY